MSGVGSQHPSWETLRQAFEKHAKEAYGEEYVLQDFVAIGYVVSMEDDDERAEYLLATSTQVEHVILGLTGQIKLFDEGE